MVSSLIIAQIVYAMIGTDHMVENSFKQSYFSSDDAHYSSLKNYFQEDMFNKLKKNTTDNTLANVICLGFVPAIAHFNGFYSLDAYQNVIRLNININSERLSKENWKKFFAKIIF